MLFQADIREIAFEEVIAAEAQRAASEPDREKSWLYAREVVDGVSDHASDIDEKIQMYAHAWSLDRMPAVDRAILRMATWEIVYNADVDAAVAINEAVELAKQYSTEDSAKFVNGVLGKIADYRRSMS
jgi:N utilization substance protein B